MRQGLVGLGLVGAPMAGGHVCSCGLAGLVVLVPGRGRIRVARCGGWPMMLVGMPRLC
jgi:hypothetical protein